MPASTVAIANPLTYVVGTGRPKWRSLLTMMAAMLSLALAVPAMAADWYAAPSGSASGTCVDTANACTIQRAIDVAAANDTVHVAPGIYAAVTPGIQINKAGLTLVGENSPFNADPQAFPLNVTPTLNNFASNASDLRSNTGTGDNRYMIWVNNVPNVKIRNLLLRQDLRGAREAIIATGSVDGLLIENNYIKFMGGSGTDRFGISISPVPGYAGMQSSVGNQPTSGGQFVTIRENVLEPTIGTTTSNTYAPKRAILFYAAVGLIQRNHIASSTADLWTLETSAGSQPVGKRSLTIDGNRFYGRLQGQITGVYGSGASTIISNNIYTAPGSSVGSITIPGVSPGSLSSSESHLLRLHGPQPDGPTIIEGNTFRGFFNQYRALWVQDRRNVEIRGNTFTPETSASDFTAITVGNRQVQSSLNTPVVFGQITIAGNTFRSGASGNKGKAIYFVNDLGSAADKGDTPYVAFINGGNDFNAGIGWYIALDDRSCTSAQSNHSAAACSGQATHALGAGIDYRTGDFFPSGPTSQKAPFRWDITSSGGTFGGISMSDMDQAQFNAVRAKTYDRNRSGTAAAVGIVDYDWTPPPITTGTITLAQDTFTWDGNAHALSATLAEDNTATCTPTPGSVTDAGSHSISVTCVSATYNVTDTKTVTVDKAAGTITWGTLAFTYNNTSPTVTATMSPGAVACTVSGQVGPDAGSWPVEAQCDSATHTAHGYATAVIARAVGTVLWNTLTYTYDGTTKTASATLTQESLACTVDPLAGVFGPNAGNYPLQAICNGANYTAAGAAAEYRTGVINKANQSINGFTATPANPTYSAGGTFALSATSVPASGGGSGVAIVFASTSPMVCTVSGNTVTMVAAGTCNLTANQAGNTNYNAAPQATLAVSIGKADQTISDFAATPASPTYSSGGTFSVSASGCCRPSALFTFASTSPAVCTVNGSTVTMQSAGTCKLTADLAGDDNYNAAPQATLDVEIGRGSQAITAFAATPATPIYSNGGTFAVSATGGASGVAVTFGSTSPAVCTVSGGTVTMLTAGTCSLTADQAGNDDYAAATQATLDVSIAKGGSAVAWGMLHFNYTGSLPTVTAKLADDADSSCVVSPASIGPQVGSYAVTVTSCTSDKFEPTGSLTNTVTIGGSTVVRRTSDDATFASVADALADNGTADGDTLVLAPGTYSGSITLTKGVHLVGGGIVPEVNRGGMQINGAGTINPPGVVIDGNNAIANGIVINAGVTGATVSGLHIKRFTNDCVAANQNNHNFTFFDNVVEQCGRHGVFANGIGTPGVHDVNIHHNAISDTYDRAIVVWNGDKRDITVADNLIERAGSSAIDFNDGTAAGIVITGNEINDSVDTGIVAIQLTSGSAHGTANLIANNLITNPGRFGISLLIPNGNGATTGDGAIVVERNDITGGAGLGGYPTDRAGISVVRRYWYAGQGQLDTTQGVVIQDNQVRDFDQINPDHEAYGIVVEGLNSLVQRNTLTNNQIDLQIQQGNPSGLPPGNSVVDASDVSNWFDRGNALFTCVSVGENADANLSGGLPVDPRLVPASASMVGSNVLNETTGARYCSINSAIAAAMPNESLYVDAGTFAENVVIDRAITLRGHGSAQTTLVPAIYNPDCSSGGGAGTLCSGGSVPASIVILVSSSDVEISDLTIDGINPSLAGHETDIAARNGIITDFNGPYANFHIHDTTVRNIWLRGIYSPADQSTFEFRNNTVQNVKSDPASIGIFNYGGSGVIDGNTVSEAKDAISANNSYGTVFSNNVVTLSSSGIHTDNSNSGAGGTSDEIFGNTVTCSVTDGYGIWTFVPYRDVSVHDNTVSACAVGIGAFGGPEVPPLGAKTTFSDNQIDGALAIGSDDTVGALLGTTTFYYGETNNEVVLTRNVITGFDIGVVTQRADGKSLITTATVNYLGGNGVGWQDDGDAVTGSNGASDFTNNWWGCNESPDSGSGCAAASGTGTFDPWLVLSLPASPINVAHGATIQIAADLNQNSNGDAVNTSALFADGSSIAFSADNGASVTTPETTTGGVAETTFSGLASGQSTVHATFENADAIVVVQITPAVITLDAPTLSAVYDTTPHAVTATTTPSGLSYSVTYNGSSTAPTNAGTYAVVATVTDNCCEGSVSGTLTINRATTTVSFAPLSFVYDGNTHTVNATLAAEPATTCPVSGTVGQNVGSYPVETTATCVGTNYEAAAASASASVTAQPTTITLSHLVQAYDGSPKSIVATTSPTAGVPVTITYDGSQTPPTAINSYAVVATLNDANYSATPATGTLQIVSGSGDIALVLNGPVDPVHVGDKAQYAATMLANPLLHAGETYGYKLVLSKSGATPLALSDIATMEVFYGNQWVDPDTFGLDLSMLFTLDVDGNLVYQFPDGIPGYTDGFPIEDPSWTWNFRFSFTSAGVYTTSAELVDGITKAPVAPAVVASIATVVEDALPPTDIHLVLGGQIEPVQVGQWAEYNGSMIADPALHTGEKFFVKVRVSRNNGAMTAADLTGMQIYLGSDWVDGSALGVSFVEDNGELYYLFPESQLPGGFEITSEEWTWNFRFQYAQADVYTAIAEVIHADDAGNATPYVFATAAISTTVVDAPVVIPDMHLVLSGPLDPVQLGNTAQYTGTLVANPDDFAGREFFVRIRLSKNGGADAMTAADLAKMELFQGGSWLDATADLLPHLYADGNDLVYLFPQPIGAFPITNPVWGWNFRFTYGDTGMFTAVADVVDAASIANVTDVADVSAAPSLAGDIVQTTVIDTPQIVLNLQGPVVGTVGEALRYTGSLSANPLPDGSNLYYVNIRLAKNGGADPMTAADLAKMEISLDGGATWIERNDLPLVPNGNYLEYDFPKPDLDGGFPITSNEWGWDFRFTYADAATYRAEATVITADDRTPASNTAVVQTAVSPRTPEISLQLQGPVAGVEVGQAAQYVGTLRADPLPASSELFFVKVTLGKSTGPMTPADLAKMEILVGGTWVDGADFGVSFDQVGGNLVYLFPKPLLDNGFPIDEPEWSWQFRFTYADAALYTATAQVIHASDLSTASAPVTIFTEVSPQSPDVSLQINGPVSGVQVGVPAAYVGTFVNHGPALTENAFVKVRVELAGETLAASDVTAEVSDGAGGWLPGMFTEFNDGLEVDFPDSNGFPVDLGFSFTHQFRITYHRAGVFSATATAVGAISADTYATASMYTEVVPYSPVTATVLIDPASLHAIYDGNPHPASVNTTPAVANVVITYNGLADEPVAAGSYIVVATVDDPLYTGSASALLIVDKAPATVTLSDLSQTYDGSPKPVTVATTPSGLATSVTYNGDSDAPTNVGSYTVVATIIDPNHTGSASGTLTISDGAAVALTMDGPEMALVTPADAPYTGQVEYTGTLANTGSATSQKVHYRISVVRIDDGNGSNGNPPAIDADDVEVCLYDPSGWAAQDPSNHRNCPQDYQSLFLSRAMGSLSGRTAVTFRYPNLAANDIQLPYTGPTPIAAPSTLFQFKRGEYRVQVDVVGSDSGLVYASATDTTSVPEAVVSYNGATSGPTEQALYSTSRLANSGGRVVGNVIVKVTLADTGAATLAPADVDFAYLDGASFLTLPWMQSGNDLVTWFGPPSVGFELEDGHDATMGGRGIFHRVGTYTLRYDVIDVATGAVVYATTSQSITIAPNAVMFTLSDLSQVYDGMARAVTVAPASVPHQVVYEATPDGNCPMAPVGNDTTPPTDAGRYCVYVTAIDTYTGSASGLLTVAKAAATVSLDGAVSGTVTRTFDGNPQVVTATATPAVASVVVTYNGSPSAPSAAGSYSLLATIDDPNHQGSTTGTLVIGVAGGATIVLDDVVGGYIDRDFTGSPVAPATATTTPSGIAYTVTYEGAGGTVYPLTSVVPTAVGTYQAVATTADANYAPVSASATLRIANASDVVLSFSATPSALPVNATSTTSATLTNSGGPIGENVLVRYTITRDVPGLVPGDVALRYDAGGLQPLGLAQIGSSLVGFFGPQPGGFPVGAGYSATTAGDAVFHVAGVYSLTLDLVGVSTGTVYGTTNGSVTVTQGSGAISINASTLNAIYNGNPHPVTVTTTPAGLAYTVTYNGGSGAPTQAGSYTVVATLDDPNYSGSDTQTLTIAKAVSPVTFGGATNVNYTGSPQSLTAVLSQESGNAGACAIVYSPGPGAPTAVGVYTVTATCIGNNYTGSASTTLTISAASANIMLSNLAQTYNGTPRPVTVTTTPGGLTTSVTYNGSGTAPTNAGTYLVVATITSPGYSGSQSATLVVDKAVAAVSIGNLTHVYNGLAKNATATTTPTGVPVTFTYNGSATAPVNAGSYTVVATANGPNHTGTATDTLVISKAVATVTLSNLSQTYNGTPRNATVATSPTGLAVSVSYDGSPTAPTPAGSYAVVATVVDVNYQGSESGTLVIGKATATVTLTNLSQTYTGSPISASAITSPAGLSVSFTYDGSPTSPTAVGSYAVQATVSDANYVGTGAGTLVITQATAGIEIGNLSQVYNGAPKAVSVTTTPAGLPRTITYDGGPTPPSAVGSYAVVVTVNDPNYIGTSNATLTITKAAATVTLSNLSQVYNGSPRPVSVVTLPSGLTVDVTYNGSPTAPTATGTYAVVATVNDPTYQGTATGTLVVTNGNATVSVTNLSQVYDGAPKPVTITTTPAGLTTSVTYNGSATVPTNAGTYTVVATVTSAGYSGSGAGTLVIAKATAAVSIGNLTHVYNGLAKNATATTTPAGVPVTFTYNGSATAPVNAGSYTVVATANGPNHTGTATDTLVISKAVATVTLSNLSQTYNGTPRPVTVTTAPPGLATSVSYDGNTIPPLAVGSYAVAASIVDANYQGSESGTLVIGKATATVTLTNLSQAYTGSPISASAITSPAGLSVNFTYDGSPTPPTAVGSYAVQATVSDASYTGTGAGTLVITQATAGIEIGNLSQVYNGAPKAVSVTTTPAGLPRTITYDGSPTPPNAVGSYAVVVTVNDPNYTGTATATLTITKASATVTLGNLSQTYDGTPRQVSVVTVPNGLTVDVTYDGSSTAPTATGTYAVVATINDSTYQGTATGTLVVTNGNATIALSNLTQTYNGTARVVTATTTPSGLSTEITYNGSTTAPTAAGTYTVVATVTSPGYTGSAAGTLVVNKATATISITATSQVYNGTQRTVTTTTNPVGLTVNVTYAGSATAPTNAGSYAVTATINDANYQGTASGTLTITKATATVALSGLSQTYSGSPRQVTVTTTPASLAVTITYNSVTTPPVDAGSYPVVATISDTNYQGTASGTLVVAKATATVTLSNLSQAYNGTPRPVTVTTSPAGLPTTVTYNGAATVPTPVGSYAVLATINSTNYEGTAAGTLVISDGTAAVTLGGLSHIYDGSPKAATATTNPSGLMVSITYNGSSTAPTNAGSYAVVATIISSGYSGTASGTMIISKASATVALGALSQTYDGTPKAATATTTPSGLAVDLTYDGSATAPTNAGSYLVVATINDTNYQGTAAGTLVIAKASATVTLTPATLTQTYNGTARVVTATTTPSGLTVDITYDGSATAPTAAGTYSVVGTINNPNYTGSAAGTLLVNKATATISITATSQVYNGTQRTVTTTTNPVGLTVNVTYAGSATAPTNAGSYAVTATINDANYQGTASGTLTITKATATVALSGLSQTYSGSPRQVTVTTTPASLAVTITYNSVTTPPVDAGSYPVVATISDTNYQGTASGTLVVAKATATVTLSNLSQAYNSTPRPVTVTTSPAGLNTIVTYNGAATVPTPVGSYAVLATIDTTNYEGTATGTLVISDGDAAVTLGNLSHIYDGSPKAATASTNPTGLSVSITYDGGSTPPTNAGSYAVVATIISSGYSGTASGTMVIAKASATVALGALSQTYDGTPKAATATTTPSGLAVDFTYDGSATAPTNAGTYLVVGTINDANYSGSATANLTIARAPATVVLGGLTQSYDGTPRPVTATTTPSGLTVAITYDGSATAPSAVGTYAVAATVTNANYDGSAVGTLQIVSGSAGTIAANGPVSFAGTVSQPLAGPMPTVKVTDVGGNPVAGVNVTFAVTTGGGILSGATPTTDSSGVATLGGWTLGASAGPQTVTATAAGVTGSVLFTATASGTVELTVSVDSGRQYVQAGRALSHLVIVNNGGPLLASGVTITSTLPAELSSSGLGWICVPSSGSSCGAATSGSGNLPTTVDIAAGGNVSFLITGIVLPGPTDLLTYSVSATRPSGTTGNDGSASRTTIVVIFRDGFDSGGDGAQGVGGGFETSLVEPDRVQVLAIDQAALAGDRITTLAQATGGAFRIEAVRLGDDVLLRLTTLRGGVEIASEWTAIGASATQLGLSLDMDASGARLWLVCGDAEIDQAIDANTSLSISHQGTSGIAVGD